MPAGFRIEPYWPPTPGRHELKFRSADVNGFTLDVTYYLTVA